MIIKFHHPLCLISVLLSMAALFQTPVQADAQNTDPSTGLISVATDGGPADNSSVQPFIALHGRYVVFQSGASNLVAGDTNGLSDIFIRDLQTGVTERISITPDGAQVNSPSFDPSVSADGNITAYFSYAANLVVGDTNGASDVFVYNRQTAVSERISLATGGTQADADCTNPIVSADGKVVAFYSKATNLVSGTTNGDLGLYVHNLQTGETELIGLVWYKEYTSIFFDTAYAALSADGRYVAYNAYPSDLTSIYDELDVYVFDRTLDTLELISKDSEGNPGNKDSYDAVISADGRYVAYTSNSDNLVSGDFNEVRDVFLYDRETDVTELISKDFYGGTANYDSDAYAISDDGRFVYFQSYATDLIEDDTNGTTTDGYIRDRENDTTVLVTISTNGAQGDNDCGYSASMSGDGRFIVFTSDATNLVEGDTNGYRDVFIRDRGGSDTTIYIPLVVK